MIVGTAGAGFISSIAWSVSGPVITATGTIGGIVKVFTCDVTGYNKFDKDGEVQQATPGGAVVQVLKFKSKDNDRFWAVALDDDVVDASTYTGAALQAAGLAFLFTNKMASGTITGIASKTLAQILTGSRT